MGGDRASICEPLRHDIPTNNGTTSIRAGFGASGLSNLGRTISDASALATLTVEWNAGYSYFDTSPIYGYGLSELRLGQFLRSRPRESFLLSTKVGRYLVPQRGRGCRSGARRSSVVVASNCLPHSATP